MMVMFLNLRKRLVNMIGQLNKGTLTLKDAKKIIITMLDDKFNYPIFIMIGSCRRDVVNLKKNDLLQDLQQAVDYIDKNNNDSKHHKC